LRIGGGYGDAADGGADFDKSGNIATDGSVKATGGVEVGQDSTSRGMVTAWDGTGGNTPGTLKLGSTNGTVGYVFMSNDRSGLRIHSSLPTSDTDGDWVKAKTVTDLSSPPAIGGATPNTGLFTSVTGRVPYTPGTVKPLVAHHQSRVAGDGVALRFDLFDSNYAGKEYGNIAGVIVANTAGSESGKVIIQTINAGSLATRFTFDNSGNFTATGDATLQGGDLICGIGGQTRGVFTAYQGAGGTAPAVLKLASAAGITYYFFVEDDGTLKVHNALPTSNSDGGEVGSQFSSTIATFTANDTTPSVLGGLLFRVPGTWTAGNNITMFDNADAGQQIVVIGGDTDCVVVDGGHLKLAGNWTATSGKTLSLVFDGTDWYETARADN
jgi:hypothetical protein